MSEHQNDQNDLSVSKSELVTAREELKFRQAQFLAECEERLEKINTLEAKLEQGSVSKSEAQEQLREITCERPNLGKPARAGRTHIVMSLPKNMPNSPAAAAPARVSGPTPMQVSANLGRVMTLVDTRIVEQLMLPVSPEVDRDDLVHEITLLFSLRRAIKGHIAAIPKDAVLLGTLVEFAEELQAILNDLESGSASRLGRLADFDQELLSALGASGGNELALSFREVVRTARTKLVGDNPNFSAVSCELAGVHKKIQTELEKRLPREGKSVLDEVATA